MLAITSNVKATIGVTWRQETKMESNIFWEKLDRDFRRTTKLLSWLINGQFQHGISPMAFPELTPERVEELYNVNFGD